MMLDFTNDPVYITELTKMTKEITRNMSIATKVRIYEQKPTQDNISESSFHKKEGTFQRSSLVILKHWEPDLDENFKILKKNENVCETLLYMYSKQA